MATLQHFALLFLAVFAYSKGASGISKQHPINEEIIKQALGNSIVPDHVRNLIVNNYRSQKRSEDVTVSKSKAEFFDEKRKFYADYVESKTLIDSQHINKLINQGEKWMNAAKLLKQKTELGLEQEITPITGNAKVLEGKFDQRLKANHNQKQQKQPLNVAQKVVPPKYGKLVNRDTDMYSNKERSMPHSSEIAHDAVDVRHRATKLGRSIEMQAHGKRFGFEVKSMRPIDVEVKTRNEVTGEVELNEWKGKEIYYNEKSGDTFMFSDDTGEMHGRFTEGDAEYHMVPDRTNPGKHIVKRSIKAEQDNLNMAEVAHSVEVELEHSRKKRSTTEEAVDAEIEVMVDSDYSVYKYYYDNAGSNSTHAEKEVYLYFAHVFNLVNLRYANIKNPKLRVKVRLAKISLTEFDDQASIFAKAHRSTGGLSGNALLGLLRNRTANSSATYANYDHVMAITFEDLYFSYGNNSYNDKSGHTHLGGVCDIVNGLATSIAKASQYKIEQTVNIAAHELAHNLGAYDDYGHECGEYMGWIMQPYSGYPSAQHFYFSCCSQNDIYNTLSDGRQCIHTEHYTDRIPELVNGQAGEKYNPDYLCQGYSPGYVACTEDEYRSYAIGICEELLCKESNNSECHYAGYIPPHGTPCGDNKWCMEAKCVSRTANQTEYRLEQPTCTLEKTNCSSNQYQCTTGVLRSDIALNESCYEKWRRCDGEADCQDGSDEHYCKCNEWMFSCDPEVTKNGSTCIEFYHICDGEEQCPNGADEANCTCAEDQHRCNIGPVYYNPHNCYSNWSRCDRYHDCYDGSDEAGCGCSEHSSFECEVSNGIYNTTQTICLYNEQICDGYPNCMNGEDESNCTCDDDGRFGCGNTTQCIDINYVCDGYPDCWDNSDEYDCPCYYGKVSCPDNSNCIYPSWYCDGDKDCADGSDEIGCACQKNGLFDCSTNSSGTSNSSLNNSTCIHYEHVCDNRTDCPNGRDEMSCNQDCPANYTKCSSGVSYHYSGLFDDVSTNPRCLPNFLQCNGKWDCTDGSDEANCTCRSDQFKCLSGECIPWNWICDGGTDCNDGSDEMGCPCGHNEYRCANSSKCIPHSYFCDNYTDCDYGEDESKHTCNATCAEDEFRCFSGLARHGTTNCVYRGTTCNGYSDCYDHSDETLTECHDKCANEAPPGSPSVYCLARHSSDSYCIYSGSGYECNWYQDCLYGEDESWMFNCSTPQSNCSLDGRFGCGNTTQCIDINYVCDGYPDCWDNSDEYDCPCYYGKVSCPDNSNCIYPSWYCDGDKDCADGSDEIGCACQKNGLFDCSTNSSGTSNSSLNNSTCIHYEHVCDNRTDCPDGRDEVSCNQDCPANYTKCSSGVSYHYSGLFGNVSTNPQCLPNFLQCNGKWDCTDGSDETNCTCRSDQFKCLSGECIPWNWICDGGTDCNDGSDEMGCPCGHDEYRCANSSKCIPHFYFCDNYTDCDYGEDESKHKCNATCAEDEFRCFSGLARHSTTNCVHRGTTCNGYSDCYDHSDETLTECHDKCANEAPPGSPSVYCLASHSSDSYCIYSGSGYECNWYQDCLYGEDESWMFNCSTPQSNCSLSEVQCGAGCVELDRICDVPQDCGLFQKLLCPVCDVGMLSCDNSTRCIDPLNICDGYQDCNDGTDESYCQPCPTGTHRCSSGAVLGAAERILNFELLKEWNVSTTGMGLLPASCYNKTTPDSCWEAHCADLSDINDCSCSEMVESPGSLEYTFCPIYYGGSYGVVACVTRYQGFFCDGMVDCFNGADEANCTYNATKPMNCTGDDFFCFTGECVPQHKVCDGTADCTGDIDFIGYSADEVYCSSCESILDYACGDKCVSPDRICDGVNDCADGSDEDNCDVDCPLGSYRCEHGATAYAGYLLSSLSVFNMASFYGMPLNCYNKTETPCLDVQCADASDILGCTCEDVKDSYTKTGVLSMSNATDMGYELTGDLVCPRTVYGTSLILSCISVSRGCDGISDCEFDLDELECDLVTSGCPTRDRYYVWKEPEAWSSDLLYPFGAANNDSDMLAVPVSYDQDYMCTRVRLNGNIGAQFFNGRYQFIYVCPDGMLSFHTEWRLWYPTIFETDTWYESTSIIAPFWSVVSVFHTRLVEKEFPGLRTRVYYHVYNSRSKDEKTKQVLTRAAEQVHAKYPDDSKFTNFKPTSVLVVTWINVAPYSECEHVALSHFLNWTVDNDMLIKCKERAKTISLNNFQAVFITNGIFSFLQYIYPEGGIQWVHPDIRSCMTEVELSNINSVTGQALAGFTSGDKEWGAGETVSQYVQSTMSMMNDDQYQIEGKQWLFRVEDSTGVQDAEQKCMDFVDNQDPEVYWNFNLDEPCPQNLWQAYFDFSFEWTGFGPGGMECFKTIFDTVNSTGVVPPEYEGLRQTCCYVASWQRSDFTALVDFAPHGGHVTDGSDEEREAYQHCCVESADLSVCRDFYWARPSSDGELYVPVSMAPFFGDPHIVTSDGVSYTFNGLGEYLFTQIENRITIQARTERVVLDNGNLGQATYFSAICVKSDQLPKVQVQINKAAADDVIGVENQLQMIIDGTEKDISLIEQDSNTTQTLSGVDTGILFKRSNASLTVFFSSGVSVNVSAINKMLTITLGLPAKFMGKTIGLTGKYDGDKENDLWKKDLTGYIPADSTESDIFDWAQTFAVSEDDSIMYYTEDSTEWSTYNENSFIPIFTDDVDSWVWSPAELEGQAYEACGNDTSCLYDVYVTGNIDVGVSSKQTADASVAVNTALHNFAPKITGSSTLYITVGEEFEYAVSVNDSNGDEVTVSTNIDTSQSQADHIVTLSATLTAATNFDGFKLTVTAKDPSGAAATKTPLAMICNCANGGTCVELSSEEQSYVQSESVVLECICPTGYTGSFCDADLDACSLVASPCYPSVLCVDNPAPADHTGYTCGDCPPGYTGDGKACTDVDECEDESKCDSICINSPGSYVCACNSGYELNADGSTCDDVDECLIDPCHHDCTNTAGSFVCSCNDGFTLNDNNIDCEPSNPCDIPSPCDDTNGFCNNVDGVEMCSCKKGYTLNADGSTCDEVDECKLGTDACEHNCVNTVGGYSCECNDGYTLASDGMACTDVNECVQDSFDCHVSQTCSNTDGGYECVCNTGQVFKDGQCRVVVVTDPVEDVTEEPVSEAKENSVKFSLEGMKISEYTVEKEINLFTILASQLTNMCSSTSCDYETVESKANRRRKRAASITFYKEYFTRLPGYPQYDDNGDLQLAIYTLVPGTGVLSSDQLLEATQKSSSSIGSTLGYTVVNVDVVYIPTTTAATTEAAQEQTTIGDTTSRNQSVIYIAIGVSAGVVLLAVILAVVVIKTTKSKQSTKTVYPTTDPEYSRKFSKADSLGPIIKADAERGVDEPPLVVYPAAATSKAATTVEAPAEADTSDSRPPSASKHVMGHNRVSTPPRDSVTPVDAEV